MNRIPNWNNLIQALPDPHILQTEEWGQVKAQFGWQPVQVVWIEKGGKYETVSRLDSVPAGSTIAAAAQILQRTVPIAGFAARLRVMYVPKGPLLDWQNVRLRDQVLVDLHRFAVHQGAIFIKIDPDVRLGSGVPGADGAEENLSGQEIVSSLKNTGWRFSNEQIQYRNSVFIDLAGTEDQILMQMKQKTRYNLRLAERKGVTVRLGKSQDLDLLFRMYAETSLRDGFVIRDAAYYHCVWKTFLEANRAQALIAEVAGEPAAALILFHFGRRAWYLYGMSRQVHREAMPNYLLQWKAIQAARSLGCRIYDLWGAPDDFNEADPMWGVYRFKEGLGGQVVRFIGAWDLPTRPLIYSLYTSILPRILDRMRRRGKESTRRQFQGA